MSFDPETTLPLIVCPKSHAALVYDEGCLVSTDPETRLRYQIRDGIPILLIDEADEVSAEDWSIIMQRHDRDPGTGEPIAQDNGQSESA